MFRHPNYYKELRKRNRVARNPMGGYSQSDQAISLRAHDGERERATGPGLQQVIEETVPHNDIEEASSDKQQASSAKLLKEQAASIKPQAQRLKLQATSFKRQDS